MASFEWAEETLFGYKARRLQLPKVNGLRYDAGSGLKRSCGGRNMNNLEIRLHWTESHIHTHVYTVHIHTSLDIYNL